MLPINWGKEKGSTKNGTPSLPKLCSLNGLYRGRRTNFLKHCSGPTTYQYLLYYWVVGRDLFFPLFSQPTSSPSVINHAWNLSLGFLTVIYSTGGYSHYILNPPYTFMPLLKHYLLFRKPFPPISPLSNQVNSYLLIKSQLKYYLFSVVPLIFSSSQTEGIDLSFLLPQQFTYFPIIICPIYLTEFYFII